MALRTPFGRDPTPRQRGKAWMPRRERWLRYQPLCQCCKAKGMVTIAMEVDHVHALINGGPDVETNLQSLCTECHKAKTAEDMGWKPRKKLGPDGCPWST